MRELFSGIEFIHSKHIIHRDVKPSNFLYDVRRQRGVLVDFGLAEYEWDSEDDQYSSNNKHSRSCVCRKSGYVDHYFGHQLPQQRGYRKEDSRPGRRANRAGTRGFRAPEVLFKCTSQTTKLDIWSAGTVLLSFLSRRFPFFNGTDDGDALIEFATIFGKIKVQQCGLLHGSIFETNIPTIRDSPFSFEQLIDWCNDRRAKRDPNTGERISLLSPMERLAVDLLKRCMDLDFRKRLRATEALGHDFFMYEEETDQEEEEEEDHGSDQLGQQHQAKENVEEADGEDTDLVDVINKYSQREEAVKADEVEEGSPEGPALIEKENDESEYNDILEGEDNVEVGSEQDLELEEEDNIEIDYKQDAEPDGDDTVEHEDEDSEYSDHIVM